MTSWSQSPKELGRTPAGLALYHSDGRWQYPRHLQLLNTILMQLLSGTLLRVILNMPPRHGKSEFFSKYLPACYLGNYPDRSVILASYEAEFAASWGGKAKQVMEQSGMACYGLEVGKGSDHHWTIAGRDGVMQTAGAGGPITGKGAHLFLVDDPIKNDRDAMSPTMRNHQWDWLVSTAMTRLEPDGAMAVLMTRWHDDDMTGRILQMAKETGEEWLHVSLPAICEDEGGEAEQFLGRKNGQALWPQRFDETKLEVIKRRSHFWWNGLYQQRPAPLEGNLVKASWFRYYETQEVNGEVFYTLLSATAERVVARKDCTIFLTVDLAASTKTSADYTVVSAWAWVRKTQELLWLDATRDRMEGPDQAELIMAMHKRHKAELIGVEATAYQLTMVQNLIRKGLPAAKLKADKDKVSRFIPAGNHYQNGLVYHPVYAAWVTEAETELLHFPNAPHDDLVDTVSYAMKMQAYLSGVGEMEVTGA